MRGTERKAMMGLRGFEEAMEIVNRCTLSGEHAEVFYDPEEKSLRAYEVDADSYIDADGFNVTGTTRAEIHDNIRKVDDYLENYQDKMSFKEYLWNIAD